MINNINTLTKNISLDEAFKEFKDNVDFRNILESENFRFVDNCFVINDNKYVKYSQTEGYILTDYAQQFPDECTLLFGYTIKNVIAGTNISVPSNMIGMTDVETEYKKIPFYAPDMQRNCFSEKMKEYKFEKALDNIQSTFEELYQDRQIGATAKSFWERATQIMKQKGISHYDFKQRSQLDDNTISRVRLQKGTITMRVAMSVCVGLDLSLSEAKNLIEMAKLAFNNDKDCVAYEFILTAFKGCSMDERNIVLQRCGVAPLGVQ